MFLPPWWHPLVYGLQKNRPRPPEVKNSPDKKPLNQEQEHKKKIEKPLREVIPVDEKPGMEGVMSEAKEEHKVPEIQPGESSKQREDDKPETGLTYKPGRFPFSVYLGSFRTKERAGKAVEEYQRKGTSPYWVMVEFKEKGNWYRIYAGYFGEIETAQSYIDYYKLTNAEIKETVYANLIGVYNNSDILNAMLINIKGLGHSPYIIQEKDNVSALFVGAYITEAGAKEQNIILQSEGINSLTVKR